MCACVENVHEHKNVIMYPVSYILFSFNANIKKIDLAKCYSSGRKNKLKNILPKYTFVCASSDIHKWDMGKKRRESQNGCTVTQLQNARN